MRADSSPRHMARDPRVGPASAAPGWGLPEWFVVVQVAGPAILFLPGMQPFRVLLRMGVFGLGLLGLAHLSRSPVRYRHPSGRFLVMALAYLALMILHPATNTYLAGLAQSLMHLAVIAPLFWAPAYFAGEPRRLARVLTILWLFNVSSAMVGILQVKNPGAWMPAEFSSVIAGGQHGVTGLQYRDDQGRVVIRPSGLGDAPGAASGAGLLAATMGLAYLGLPVSNTRRLVGICGVMIGVAVIFLTQVRSALLMFVGSSIVFVFILVLQRRVGTALALTVAMIGCGVGSLQYASSLGGQSIVTRFGSLLEDDPLAVYDRSSRLGMVTGAFDTLLFQYPLGAGLGRWGMMRAYFGDERNLDSPSIWAEVQFPAWILDGGFVYTTLYIIALLIAVRRLATLTLRHPSPEVRQWAGTIAMLSASPIALMFSYTPFNSQMGMQFWFLIGAIEGVAMGRPDR